MYELVYILRSQQFLNYEFNIQSKYKPIHQQQLLIKQETTRLNLKVPQDPQLLKL